MLPLLADCALFALLQSEWKKSDLSTLYAQLAHSHEYSRSDNSDVEDPQLGAKINKETQLAEKAILNVSKDWPEVLADKWRMVTQTIIKEIRLFSCQLARCHDYLDHDYEMDHNMSLEQVLFCVKRIQITQNGFINKKQTLLKILEDSNLKLQICPVILMRNDIGINTIHCINQKIQNLDKRNLLKFYEDCYSESIELDWEMKCEERSDRSDERYWNADNLSYLLARRHFETARALCNSNTEENNERRQTSFLKAAMFVAEMRDHFDEETIIFLYDQMDSKTWLRLLKREGCKVFRCLISSWRYRYLCVESYKMMVEQSLEVKFYEWLFPYVMPVPGLPKNHQSYNKYHRREILGVLVKMWNIAPLKIHQTKGICTFFIPTLIASHLDFHLMCNLIEFYPEEILKEAMANVVFELQGRDLIEHIPDCMKVAERFNLTKGDILNKDQIKKYIFHSFSQCCINPNNLVCQSLFDDSKTYAVADTKINSLIKLAIDSNEEVNQLKQEFLEDKTFVANMIENFVIRDKKSCGHFLLWLHSFNKERVLEFVDQAVHDESILKAYIELFMNDKGSTRGLYKIIEAGEWAGRMVLRHRDVLFKWLGKLARDKNYENSHELRARFFKLFKSQKVPKRVISDFFKSPEGHDCVLDLFRNIESIELEVHFHGKNNDFLERFTAFKSLLIPSKEIEKQITCWLTQFGHPNSDPEQKIRVRGQDYRFDNDELKMARKIVDAYYRIFLVILKSNMMFFPSTGDGTITEYSMSIMHRNGDYIPQVI